MTQNASCLNFDDQRLCPNFKKKVFTELHSYLRQVEFKDVDNKTFHFSGQAQHKHKHDGPPRYSIINFQKITSSKEVIRRRLSIKDIVIRFSCFADCEQIDIRLAECRHLPPSSHHRNGQRVQTRISTISQFSKRWQVASLHSEEVPSSPGFNRLNFK